MRALIDSDILLHECGWGAETGWKAVTNTEDIPPWEYVEEMLLQKIGTIVNNAGADCYTLFITETKSFRYDIAKNRPYKGQRNDKRPWHFNNLRVYVRDVLGAVHVDGLEADDVMCIEAMKDVDNTIICSRDKDLKQCYANVFSWELGKQASFGPERITQEGGLTLGNKNKLTGTGLPWMYAQMLIGDTTDSIPGCPGVGPVRAFEILRGRNSEEMLSAVINEYQMVYGENWEQEMLEQGRLVFLIRKLHPDGSPVMYEIGMVD